MLRTLLLLLLLPALAWANSAPSKAELDKLKSRIQELSNAQSRDLRKKDALQADLREAELRLSKLAREQRGLEQQVSAAQEKLQNLEQQQTELAKDKRTQLAWLARTVLASYQAGRQERLKLLLNQEHPDQIARLLRYQEYYQNARGERLQQLDSELSELQAISLKVGQARQHLLEQRSQVQQHAAKLQQAQQQRQQALASLERNLNTRTADINQLKKDQQRLERLLQDMQRSVASLPVDNGGRPFGKLAGKLPWPVNGSISASYNSRREGALRWQGVVLKTAPGSPVRAVHAGRVVYADWLRGYGLLTIVDHGDGYLTLYGHSQSLLREVGEWVASGDSLALAGDAGVGRTSGLYFEIRHRGKAMNPTHWCNRHVTLPPLAANQ